MGSRQGETCLYDVALRLSNNDKTSADLEETLRKEDFWGKSLFWGHIDLAPSPSFSAAGYATDVREVATVNSKIFDIHEWKWLSGFPEQDGISTP